MPKQRIEMSLVISTPTNRMKIYDNIGFIAISFNSKTLKLYFRDTLLTAFASLVQTFYCFAFRQYFCAVLQCITGQYFCAYSWANMIKWRNKGKINRYLKNKKKLNR